MRLRELELDAPKHPRRLEFRGRTRCVAALMERYLPTTETKDVWKVIVECLAEDAGPRTRNLLGVLVVGIQYDVSAHFRLAVTEQRKVTAQLLLQGTERAASEMGISNDPFVIAYQEAASRHFVNEWIGSAKWNPGRTMRAELLCVHDEEAFEARIQVTDRTGQVRRTEVLFKCEPEELIFVPRLGPLKWESKTRIAFSSKDGTNVSNFTVPDGAQ